MQRNRLGAVVLERDPAQLNAVSHPLKLADPRIDLSLRRHIQNHKDALGRRDRLLNRIVRRGHALDRRVHEKHRGQK